MTATRRQVLRVAAGLALGVPLSAGCDYVPTQPLDTTGKGDFNQPLAIPPLAPYRTDSTGRRVFDLTAQPGQREFQAGQATRTFGVNGDYLGPTLRAGRGDEVTINVHNALTETTSMHWHGMHLPASADGGPHQPIAAGATWSPRWRIDQPAATLWYHPHPHGRTEKHVYRGMAGMFIVDDDESAGLDLPHRYGVDDIPVIVQDKRFTANGQFDERDHRATGLLGDTVLVNGTLGPYQQVSTQRVRLRLLNASTARVYAFGFADDRQFALIGTDGGLLGTPYQTRRIQLSPGERADIVVSMNPNERVVLRSYPPSLGTDPGITRIAGGDDSLDVLELRAAGTLAAVSPVPDRLATVPRLAPAAAPVRRTFRLADRQINGRRMSMDRIDEVVTKGSTEIWEVRNLHEEPHSFHVHDVQFQVQSVDGAAPPAPLAGWKDTIYLPPQVPIRIAVRFADYADPGRPYMYHCHLLFHEDLGMMGQFVVVEPGQAVPGPDTTHQHHHGTNAGGTG
jgi:FtsP/CotA-like multicopper oxidase with cupredoxin domain